jgi:hypothetical protein
MNTQVYLSAMDILRFERNLFWGNQNNNGYIKAIAGSEATVINKKNKFRGEYKSCYDLLNTNHTKLYEDDIHAGITEYGIHLSESYGNGTHGRLVESGKLTNTFGGGIAGISLIAGGGLEDDIQYNNVAGFTNGIEYFQPTDYPYLTDATEIKENKVDALRSGIVVSYAEDPYNNFSGVNTSVSGGYGFEIKVNIKCNRIKADYGLLGTGWLLDQSLTQLPFSSPVESDAGNFFACNHWDILWGDMGIYYFKYYAPAGYVPNTTIPFVNLDDVLLDGSPYGVNYTNEVALYSTYPSNNTAVMAASCRPYAFDDQDKGARLATGAKDVPATGTGTRVYPNPAHEVLHIEAGNIEQGVAEFCDLTGRVLYTAELSGNMQINTSTWSEGVYLVKILDKGQLKGTEKLILVK